MLPEHCLYFLLTNFVGSLSVITRLTEYRGGSTYSGTIYKSLWDPELFKSCRTSTTSQNYAACFVFSLLAMTRFDRVLFAWCGISCHRHIHELEYEKRWWRTWPLVCWYCKLFNKGYYHHTRSPFFPWTHPFIRSRLKQKAPYISSPHSMCEFCRGTGYCRGSWVSLIRKEFLFYKITGKLVLIYSLFSTLLTFLKISRRVYYRRT